MAEDTQQAQSPVNDTPVAPTPSAQPQGEQKTLESQPASQDGLPEEASERTRERVKEVLSQAEMLKKELQQERLLREQTEAAFKALSRPKPVEDDEPIWDQNTGLIDGQKLTALQKEAKQAKREAEEARSSFAQYLKQQEERQAYQEYPWLNPNDKDKFDQDKYNLATGIALSSMVHPERFGGKQLDLKGAGQFVAKLTSAQVEKIQEEAAQQAIEQLSPKEQAALEATGTAGRRDNTDQEIEYETVREVTRKGGQEGMRAIEARLRALKKNQAST